MNVKVKGEPSVRLTGQNDTSPLTARLIFMISAWNLTYCSEFSALLTNLSFPKWPKTPFSKGLSKAWGIYLVTRKALPRQGVALGSSGIILLLMSRKKKESNHSVVVSYKCCSTGDPLSLQTWFLGFLCCLGGFDVMAKSQPLDCLWSSVVWDQIGLRGSWGYTHMIMVPCRGALPFMLLATFWFNCVKLGS